jgi:hypothetical protein
MNENPTGTTAIDKTMNNTTLQIIVALVSLANVIILMVNNFVKEGILFPRRKLSYSERVNLAKEISYDDNKSRNKFTNSLIFSAMTGRQTPNHKVNLILNCYDPALATYIYSKAPNYIKFEEDKLIESKNLFKWSHKLLMWFISFLLLSSLFLLIYGSYGLVETLTNREPLHKFIGFLGIVTLWGFSSWAINYSLNEFTFISKVKKFYSDYESWKKHQQ